MRLRIYGIREIRSYDEKEGQEFDRLFEQAERDNVDLPSPPEPKTDIIAEMAFVNPKELSCLNDCLDISVLLKELPDGTTIGDEFEVHFERVPTANKIGPSREEYYPKRRRRASRY